MSRSNNIRSTAFTQFAVIQNSSSTHFRRALHKVSELQHAYPDIPIEIVEPPAAGGDPLSSVVAKLGPKTLLCIAGGDGTVNCVVNNLINDRLAAVSARAVILPLWGGNGNDLAYLLNGSPRTARLPAILEEGNVVPIRPLSCKMTYKDGRTNTLIAAFYLGFGASGAVSRQFNDPRYRTSRLYKMPGGSALQALSTASSTAIRSPAFTIKESGAARRVYEISIFNGARAAKIYRRPVSLLDDSFYVDVWESSHPIITPVHATFALRRPRSEEHLKQYTSFTIQTETWGNFDGEPFRVPAETRVEINRFERPFYALSSKLR